MLRAALGEGGQFMPCGWLTDRFCVSRQIVPRPLLPLLVHVGPAAKPCAPCPGRVIASSAKELEGCDASSGAIRVPPDDALRAALAKTLVGALRARHGARPARRADGAAAGRMPA